MLYVLNEFACVSPGLFYLVYAYNFFVYVIIGKQFRRELRSFAPVVQLLLLLLTMALLLLCHTRNRPTSKAVFERANSKSSNSFSRLDSGLNTEP